MPDLPPHPLWSDAKGETRAQRLARERLTLHLHGLERDDAWAGRIQALAPDAWQTLEADLPLVEKKTKVTLRLDESVAKFFRAMGPGYQARINRLLATYAQMRIAEVYKLERFARSRDRSLGIELPEE
ncbi:BrnA antitoxin family protein [Dinoroseobacter sp. PD6]|uniref:BrnA antitoxin family protein n=1 Tax=Dinoroseobacter sp. PD6 TaxID=3028384 RepID=UPI00237A4EA6|nr:BrnA antitoxin family protein [Dinoroseobacter sp. PD6]MDD9716555.1 BrnA antitoxin family protein [Dinoroseobacter sp. PD6]